MGKTPEEILMTPYERRIVRGSSKTTSDLLNESKMVRTVLKTALTTGVDISGEEVNEKGELVKVNGEAPLITVLVAKRLNYLLEHPAQIDLKELSTALGENGEETTVHLQGADAMFGDIVLRPKAGNPDQK